MFLSCVWLNIKVLRRAAQKHRHHCSVDRQPEDREVCSEAFQEREDRCEQRARRAGCPFPRLTSNPTVESCTSNVASKDRRARNSGILLRRKPLTAEFLQNRPRGKRSSANRTRWHLTLKLSPGRTGAHRREVVLASQSLLNASFGTACRLVALRRASAFRDLGLSLITLRWIMRPYRTSSGLSGPLLERSSEAIPSHRLSALRSCPPGSVP